jgi:toxin CcdB
MLSSMLVYETRSYLLDVQSDLLQGLETRVVVPLRPRDQFPVVGLSANLIPAFEIEGIECLLETPKLAAIPLCFLKTPVTSLAANHFEIIAALDFLFQGY